MKTTTADLTSRLCLVSVIFILLIAVIFSVPASVLVNAAEIVEPECDAEIIRLAGDTRIDTAVIISRMAESLVSGSDCVYAANGFNFPDALAAVPATVGNNSVLLLTHTESADTAAVNRINELSPEKLVVCGGSGAVSDAAVSAMKGSASVERVYGSNRYETACRLAMRAKDTDTVAFLVSGENYPDALSIGPVAGILNAPVFLCPRDGNISFMKELLQSGELTARHFVIVGGTGAVSENAAVALRSFGVDKIERIAGADRYETSCLIYEKYSDIFSDSVVSFATGANYPDALAGGVMSSYMKAPLILLRNNGDNSRVEELLFSKDIEKAYVYGGHGALSNITVKYVLDKNKSTVVPPTVGIRFSASGAAVGQIKGAVLSGKNYVWDGVSDLSFTVTLSKGYTLNSVSCTYGKTSKNFSPDSTGKYTVPASFVSAAGTEGLTVTAKTTAPTTATTSRTTVYSGRSNFEDVLKPNYSSPYYIIVYTKNCTVRVLGKDNNGGYTRTVYNFLCSSGANDKTPSGLYSIDTRYSFRAMFGGVYAQYAVRFYGNYLFHSVPYYKMTKDTLEMAEYEKLGSQASLGCVRLCVRDAKWIYDNCPNGTQVRVITNKNGPAQSSCRPIPKLNYSKPYNGWDPTDPDPKNPYNK